MSWNIDNTTWTNGLARLRHLGSGEWEFRSADLSNSLETDGGSEDKYAGKLTILWESGQLQTYYNSQNAGEHGTYSGSQTGTYTFSGNGPASIRIGYSYPWNEGAGTPTRYTFTETTISNGTDNQRANYESQYGPSDRNFGIDIPEINPDNPAASVPATPCINSDKINLQTGDVVGFSTTGYRVPPPSDEDDNQHYTANVFSEVFDYIEWYPYHGNHTIGTHDGWATPIPTFMGDDWRALTTYSDGDYQRTLGYLYDNYGVVSGYVDGFTPQVFPGVTSTNRNPLGSFKTEITSGYPPSIGAPGNYHRFNSSNTIHGWVGTSKWVITYSGSNTSSSVQSGTFILGAEITNASPESNSSIRNTAWSAKGTAPSSGCGGAGSPIFGSAGDKGTATAGALCAPDYYENRHPVLTESPYTVAECAVPATTHSMGSKITINTSGGEDPIKYSIDGSTYQDSNIFNDVDLPAGEHTAYAKDAINCIVTHPFTINATSATPTVAIGDVVGVALWASEPQPDGYYFRGFTIILPSSGDTVDFESTLGPQLTYHGGPGVQLGGGNFQELIDGDDDQPDGLWGSSGSIVNGVFRREEQGKAEATAIIQGISDAYGGSSGNDGADAANATQQDKNPDWQNNTNAGLEFSAVINGQDVTLVVDDDAFHQDTGEGLAQDPLLADNDLSFWHGDSSGAYFNDSRPPPNRAFEDIDTFYMRLIRIKL